MPDQSALSWLAGFIDGEGYIGVRSTQGWYALSLTIGNTHLRSLERCIEIAPGFGGPYTDKRVPPRRPSWRVTIQGKKAKELLEALYPHLVTKKQQAAIGLVFPIGNGGPMRPLPSLAKIVQEECYKALKAVNHGELPYA
jgi:hypothetical protein